MKLQDKLSVKCLQCGYEAIYDACLFRVLGIDEKDSDFVTVKHSGLVYVVKYPDLYTWQEVHGKSKKSGGVVQCNHCHARYALLLNWPQDAFYQLAIANNCLWGCDRTHFAAIRDFLSSVERDPTKHACEYYLRHLPNIFLSSKRREEIVKKINKILETSYNAGNFIPTCPTRYSRKHARRNPPGPNKLSRNARPTG